MAAEVGAFAFQEPTSETGVLNVHFHAPAGWRADGPILIVMHGYKRNAETYRHDWQHAADELGALLLTPEFDKEGYPTPRAYEVGAMRTHDRKSWMPPDLWTWSAVERAFDAAKARFGATRNTYWLYGHSAGGQFVHRLALYQEGARAEHIIAANAGAYSAIDDQRFPYGLGQNGPPVDVPAFLAKRITLLLGQKDRNTTAKVLLRSPEAMIQGPHRLARGRFFYQAGLRAAASLDVPINWRIVEAPDVGHSNRSLAPIAGRLFGAEASVDDKA